MLGGTNLNLDLALDVAYAVKTLIYPSSSSPASPRRRRPCSSGRRHRGRWWPRRPTGGPAGIADLLAIQALSGAPDKTKSYDGHDATSIGQAAAESIITALGYGTWGRYDIEQRLGGDPSQNDGTDYGSPGRLTPGASSTRLAPGQLDRVLAALAAGPGVSADAAARAKADTLGNPTGAIAKPTVTLHTEDDPLVISQNENVFAHRADAQGQQLRPARPDPDGAAEDLHKRAVRRGALQLHPDRAERVVTSSTPGSAAGIPGARRGRAAFNYTVDDADTSKNTPAKVADGTASTGYQPVDAPAAWPAPDSGSPTKPTS